MRFNSTFCCTVVAVALSVGCDKTVSVTKPEPMELHGEEIGYFCNMIVNTHLGPKGQVFLSDRDLPRWFTSVRDTIAFTMLPGEPKNISAVYVSDMGTASWDHPEPGTWVEASQAWYVVGSNRVGGMGAPETVPFAQKSAAEAFKTQHGGRVVRLGDIPQHAVLGFEGPAPNQSSITAAQEPM